MDWLQNTPFFPKRAGFFISGYEVAEDFLPIRIKHHAKTTIIRKYQIR
jgi:hypothetical protein